MSVIDVATGKDSHICMTKSIFPENISKFCGEKSEYDIIRFKETDNFIVY
jgi:hypothetical protein